MRWLKTDWRLWLCITIGWSLIGLAYTFNYSHYAPNYVKIFSPQPQFLQMLKWEMPYWLLWAMLSPLVFWLTHRFRLESGRLLRNSLIHIAAFLTFCFTHRALYLFIDWGLRVKAYRRLGSLSEVFNQNFFFNLPNGFLCYVVILVAGTYYRHYQEEELKVSRLKGELEQVKLQMAHQMTQAQLQALKMQLQPHFLSNTLNSISATLDEDAEAAEEMLARLGDFLRLTLDNSGAQEVTLQEEMEFLRCYLEIERVRFSDRLTVKIEISSDTYEAMVPNFILQPIVENAIRHGIMGRVGAGRIEIRSRRENGWLRLEVEDNGSGLHASSETDPKAGRGIGFALTRERLECLYAERQSLSLSDAPQGGGLLVLLEIPYHTSSDTSTASPAQIKERTVAV